jgi:hypothetical protein
MSEEKRNEEVSRVLDEHKFLCRIGQKNITFQVCREKNTVKNIVVTHDFGQVDTLTGSYTLEELASSHMNRADVATAISRRLTLERNRTQSQGGARPLPW